MHKYLIPPRVFIPAIILMIFLSSGSSVFDYIENEKSVSMQESIIKLPDPVLKGELTLEEALEQRRSVRRYRNEPVEFEQVSRLLWAAQGVTQRSTGFRTAPSAGATYPLEVYLVAGNVNELNPGLYRYLPGEHSISRLGDTDLRQDLEAAALGQGQVGNAPAVIVIAADYSRTAQRYGERAVRYVHMETGHAGQNISLQAVSLGLGSVIVGAFEDDQVKSVLDLPANIEPLYIIPVGTPL